MITLIVPWLWTLIRCKFSVETLHVTLYGLIPCKQYVWCSAFVCSETRAGCKEQGILCQWACESHMDCVVLRGFGAFMQMVSEGCVLWEGAIYVWGYCVYWLCCCLDLYLWGLCQISVDLWGWQLDPWVLQLGQVIHHLCTLAHTTNETSCRGRVVFGWGTSESQWSGLLACQGGMPYCSCTLHGCHL